jgi:gametolysin peptidase M11
VNTRSQVDATLHLGATLLVTLLALPAWAHNAVEAVPTAPSTSAPVETVAGTLDELIVENRVLGTTRRYVSLQQGDGRSIMLLGASLDGMAKGSLVEASGRRSGNLLFVSEAHPQHAGAFDKSAKQTTQNEVMQAQGSLLVGHGDDFATGNSTFNLLVRANGGELTPLKLAMMPDILLPGARVIATGTKADDGFSLAANHIAIVAPPPPVSRSNVTEKAATTNNVLVILIKFAGSSTADPFTRAQVEQVMATSSTSVVNYYNEASYGQHVLRVTVTDWLTSPEPIPDHCNMDAIAFAANAAARTAGYNVGADPPAGGAYQNIFYVFPNQSACSWGGYALIGFGRAWSNGFNVLRIFAHELGHNFGLLHAGSLDCSGASVTPGMSGCSSSEYGDPFSVMGGQTNDDVAMQFNAEQKTALGWIPPTSVVTYAGGTVTYTLTPIETSGGNTYAVKIPAALDRTFWVEYRQPIGSFDSAIEYAHNGAQVRVSSPFQSICAGCSDDTQLLFMPGGSPGNFYDAALLAGQAFSDSGLTLSVLSASPTSLTVQVSDTGSNPGRKNDVLWKQASARAAPAR